MDQEAEIFRQFSKSTAQSDLVDITREISVLREMKDVVDELGIMSKLFVDQLDVLGILREEKGPGWHPMHSDLALEKIRNMDSLSRKVTDDVCWPQLFPLLHMSCRLGGLGS